MSVTANPPPAPSSAPAAPQAFRRKTSRTVQLVDRLTTIVITTGGLMVVVAVLGIMVYLTSVVLPLFRGATIHDPVQYPLLTPDRLDSILFVELDEYQRRGVWLDKTGHLTLFDARTGQTLEERTLLPATPAVTAFRRSLRHGHVIFGFADGSTRLGVIEITPEGLVANLEDPVIVGQPGVAVHLLDYKVSGNREVFTILTAGGELFWDEVTRRQNIVTGKTTLRVNKHDLPFTPAATPPAYLLQNAQGDQVFIAWRDGTVRRYDLRRIAEPVVAETTDLVPGAGEITNLEFMFGDQSLIVSDSNGGVTAWFRAERAQAGTVDGYQLVPAHRLEGHAAPVSATGFSTRDKGLLTGTTQGEIFLRHMTSEQVLGKVKTPGAVRFLQVTPKADGIFAVDATGQATLWPVDNPHPETTWRTIFGKVWYEGYNQPEYTWQSSSGNDDFEPKFSLVPLIFGTLKATFYSLMFAIPIALLGAIYTSQFLDKRIRAPVKSTIETMASLPSVVLGFIAALVLAPIVEHWIMAVLTAFAVIPLTVLLFGYLWQMLPNRVLVRYAGWQQFVMLLLLVVAGAWLARLLSGPVESLLFAGDFKAWLNGRRGTGTSLLALLAWPWALLAVWLAQRRFLSQRFSGQSHQSRVQVGLIELAKLIIILATATTLAWAVGALLNGLGFDPRASLLGTYVQRNTLVVGFVMGFAVIPIIYTISEDALTSVPEHLRAASLGCGATPWQTAVRVILPVAMSGIFSAVMIGLGRAVGETMIVVMAAGNTPIMDINIFNGLRALSANIAVELPEAVKDGTLYRMLFLAALALFLITFLLNTVAEIIRMRFRKRAYQL